MSAAESRRAHLRAVPQPGTPEAAAPGALPAAALPAGARPLLAVPAAAAHWAPLLEGLPLAAWVVALADRSVVASNAHAAALLGRAPAELLGAAADALLPTPEDHSYWVTLDAEAPDVLDSDTRLAAPDGRTLHVQRCIRPLPAGAGAPVEHLLVSVRDCSSEQRILERQEAIAAELRATLESTADGILVTDLSGHLLSFNRRFARLWGMPDTVLEADDPRSMHEWMRRCVGEPEAYEQRLRAIQEAALLSSTDQLHLHSGLVLERVSRPLWQRGRAVGRVYSFRDLTRQLEADQRIEALVLTDDLTGLSNRRRLAQRVAKAMHGQGVDTHFALLVVDLDRFRQINDSLGHEAGDQTLRVVAQRIQGCLRGEDEVARIGGDQFALLAGGADAAAAERLARRVLNAVAQPLHLNGSSFTLTCSIGVALSPKHGQTLDDLVRHAETAMHDVKGAGRAHFRLHDARVHTDLREHMKLDHAMRQALVSGRFRLAYQPQVDLATGAVVGAEALLRWRDPELGEVSPARIIPVAEETGFIVAIGDWVLSQALRQAALWHAAGTPLPIAINVSALQFQQASFVERVASMLAVSGLPPQLLELELTESILLRDADDALHRLHALDRLGVRLAIDDFGTGYSSLAYLKRFPIDKLKIDRSFVRDLPADDSDAGIVRAVLQMARALGKRVVAEGVETEPQRAFLQAEGCSLFQGFLYSPAIDAVSFERRVLAQAPKGSEPRPDPRRDPRPDPRTDPCPEARDAPREE